MDTPGAYLRELQRSLGMPMGALEYHLGQLEKAGLLSVLHDENKRFFPARMDAADKRYLALLRQEACRRIVLALIGSTRLAHRELQAATGYPASTLSYYLAKLVETGLATRTKEGRGSLYALVDAGRAYGLLVRYRPTFLDSVLDRFLEAFDSVRVERRRGS